MAKEEKLATPAARSLRRYIDRRATGCLSIGGPERVSAYLLQGDVVASERPDEPEILLRRALARGLLRPARYEELLAAHQAGEPVFGTLLEEVDPGTMEDILQARFRDNLTLFLGSQRVPRFVPLGAIFVDNLQIGLDTQAVLAECQATWDVAATLSPEALVGPGNATPSTPDDVAIVRIARAIPHVGTLIQRLPAEPVAARVRLALLVRQGVLALTTADDDAVSTPSMGPPQGRVRAEAPPADPWATFTPPDAKDPADVLIYEEGVTPAPRPLRGANPVEAPRALGPSPFARPAEPEPAEPPLIAPALRPPIAAPGARPPAPSAEVRRKDTTSAEVRRKDTTSAEVRRNPTAGEVRRAAPPISAEVRSPDVAEAVAAPVPARSEAPAPQVRRVEAPRPAPEPPPSVPPAGTPIEAARAAAAKRLELKDFLDQPTDEIDLDAFDDHDTKRGSEGDGLFSARDLDKVEIVDLAIDEPIPMGEAPGLDEPSPPVAPDPPSRPLDLPPRKDPPAVPAPSTEAPSGTWATSAPSLHAPTLTERDARDRISAANQVLGVVSSSFDRANGAGSGRAAIQLLVDGASGRRTALFQGVHVRMDGRLPPDALMTNLGRRPTAEHRVLLQDGLSDLIDRALSSAADELPEDEVDAILERSAGYRHRLGP